MAGTQYKFSKFILNKYFNGSACKQYSEVLFNKSHLSKKEPTRVDTREDTLVIRAMAARKHQIDEAWGKVKSPCAILSPSVPSPLLADDIDDDKAARRSAEIHPKDVFRLKHISTVSGEESVCDEPPNLC